MNDKQSKQLDICLAILSMASAKGADSTDMLNAFAYDMNLISKFYKEYQICVVFFLNDMCIY